MRYFTREQLDRAFNAKTVVVIGTKKSTDYMWLRRFTQFKGTLYSVHVNPESAREIEARGVKNFASILDVPGPVDYVVVTTPRRSAEEVFAQCVRAGRRRGSELLHVRLCGDGRGGGGDTRAHGEDVAGVRGGAAGPELYRGV